MKSVTFNSDMQTTQGKQHKANNESITTTTTTTTWFIYIKKGFFINEINTLKYDKRFLLFSSKKNGVFFGVFLFFFIVVVVVVWHLNQTTQGKQQKANTVHSDTFQ